MGKPMKPIIGIASVLVIILIMGRGAASPCHNQQNDLQMINDLNDEFAQGRMPMIPTGMGAGAVVDLGGQVTDFRVIADNGGLLDCTLQLVRPQANLHMLRWGTVRIRYWRNIAGQLLHQVTALQRAG